MRQETAVEARAPARRLAHVDVEASLKPNGAAPQRLGYVDGLRALAALYVVLNHIGIEVWRYNNPPAGLAWALAVVFSNGHFAVSVFIVLSGFSLMLPVARRGNTLPWGVWGFYWRRARRILPPYYLAMAFSLLLIWLFIGQKTSDSSIGRSIVLHVLLVQNLSTDSAINPAFWSIAMECQIYLFFPLFVLLWRRYPPLFAAALITFLSFVALVCLATTWVGQMKGYAGYAFVPQYFGLFAIGMCAASAYTTQTPRWLRLRDWYVWELVALVCFVVLAVTINSWPIYALDLLAATGTVGLLFAASRPGPRNPVRAALDGRPLVWVGGFSYSVYLIHAPLIQLLWQYGLRPLGFGLGMLPTYLALVVTGVPLILAASWGFWYVCERPFLNSRPAGWRARSAVIDVPVSVTVRGDDKTR
ncbi:MAG TPA: acyltransferase [Ktedonobacterales bacterium]|nr:acyltransferase [Ktedonobacterales bacterium]